MCRGMGKELIWLNCKAVGLVNPIVGLVDCSQFTIKQGKFIRSITFDFLWIYADLVLFKEVKDTRYRSPNIWKYGG